MGGCCSRPMRNASIVDWKVVNTIEQEQQKYVDDASMPFPASAQHIELRLLLDEPDSQKLIGNYAKRADKLCYLMCWIDIQVMKGRSTGVGRREIAEGIHNKYIDQKSPIHVPLTAEEILNFSNIIFNDAEESIKDENGNDQNILVPLDANCLADV